MFIQRIINNESDSIQIRVTEKESFLHVFADLFFRNAAIIIENKKNVLVAFSDLEILQCPVFFNDLWCVGGNCSVKGVKKNIIACAQLPMIFYPDN